MNSHVKLHQLLATQRSGAVSDPVWLLAFPRLPVTPGTPRILTIFSPCCSLNDDRRAVRSLFENGRLFSFFFWLSLTRLLIVFFFLMSNNVYPNPGPIFLCSVCAGNMTWRGRSVQYCTYSKWVDLRFSLLSFSRFRTLGSSHSWSVPASSRRSTFTNTLSSYSDFSSLCTSIVLSGTSGLPLLMQHYLPILVFKPLTLLPLTSNLLLLAPPQPLALLVVSLYFLLFPPDFLRVFQWNAEDLKTRSAKLLHFIPLHHVDLVCIQDSNINSSFSFRISGFPALRSDRTHSRSGIFSPDDPHPNNVSSFSSGSAYPSLNFLPPLSLFFTLTLLI